MPFDLIGTWKLVAWRRVAEDGSVTYPLGAGARGLLVYTSGGTMAVHMSAADRPLLPTEDPLGGDTEERAAAYSTCLAYAGSYEVHGDTVVHKVDVSLFPNWQGEEQRRQIAFEGGELVLRSPPVDTADGKVVNEIVWKLEDR